jgi:dienelactone hydrolase
MLRKLVLLIGLGLSATASQGVEIKLTGQDGFQLYGDYVAASHGQGKGVLMLHQCNADRSMYESLATQLAKSGISSMSLDFRGYGDSVTDEISIAAIREKASSREHYFEIQNQLGLGKNRSHDVELAYRYLLGKLDDNARISIIGASCGGTQAVLLAQKHKPQSFIFFSAGMNQETIELFDQVSDVPALIVTAQDDTNTFVSSNQIFLNANNEDTRLLSYKGEGHGIPLFKQDQNLESMMVIWFGQHMN